MGNFLALVLVVVLLGVALYARPRVQRKDASLEQVSTRPLLYQLPVDVLRWTGVVWGHVNFADYEARIHDQGIVLAPRGKVATKVLASWSLQAANSEIKVMSKSHPSKEWLVVSGLCHGTHMSLAIRPIPSSTSLDQQLTELWEVLIKAGFAQTSTHPCD